MQDAGALVAGCGALFPDQGSKPGPCIGSVSLSHWTTEEAPHDVLSIFLLADGYIG